MKHKPYGSEVPFAEPAWYRGVPTPFYEEKHAVFRDKVRKFVESELVPNADEWDEAGSCPIKELRLAAHKAGVLSPWAPADLGGTPPEGASHGFSHERPQRHHFMLSLLMH
eukprot:TRINITY_DN5604_c0_g1_i1.p1 TRINITY_DN5604_c0_g1~~TRINITY_DN5604_c0_g1_i1.p1  ORF type:complete len:111 (-),score=23.29 TRINITY_DN5604_c0_g1_i1:7-339(-)